MFCVLFSVINNWD